jgi:glycosyltransferase involved in cell wall biosynthesis
MGGGERAMCELGSELARRGHEVEFYALPFMMGSKPKGDPASALGGIPYHEGWSQKIEADIAYTFYHPLSSINFRVKGRKIASFHSQAFFLRSVSPRYGLIPVLASYGTKLLGPLELRSFDAVHVVGPREQRLVESRLTEIPGSAIRHKKVYVIPGWVNTSVFRPSSEKYDEFTVLFSGRALWQKGWDIYVRLARRMKDLGVRFLYVGGVMKDSVIQSLGFQWNTSALSRIYTNSHVLFNPSRADTFGRASIESMACGTPVVTTPSQLRSDLNLPFVYGNSLAEHEESILRLKGLWEAGRPYRQLSNRCSEAAQAFSFESVVNAYERMFLDVLSESPG